MTIRNRRWYFDIGFATLGLLMYYALQRLLLFLLHTSRMPLMSNAVVYMFPHGTIATAVAMSTICLTLYFCLIGYFGRKMGTLATYFMILMMYFTESDIIRLLEIQREAVYLQRASVRFGRDPSAIRFVDLDRIEDRLEKVTGHRPAGGISAIALRLVYAIDYRPYRLKTNAGIYRVIAFVRKDGQIAMYDATDFLEASADEIIQTARQAGVKIVERQIERHL